MSNLLNFFFSFDKLMKEKLVIAFYWLAIIVAGMNYFSEALSAIKLGPLAKIVGFFNWFLLIVLTLVTLRLLCEIAVAVFRINNNLSPDGGRSETADIDPMAEARKAAEAAAARAREVTKTAGEKASAATKTAVEKTRHATDGAKDSVDNVVRKADITKSPNKRGRPAGSKNKKAVTKATKTQIKSETAPKRRGRPTGSKNKTVKKKTPPATTSTAPKKRGPKPGTKRSVNKDGIRLKKDGTPAKKPGPRKK